MPLFWVSAAFLAGICLSLQLSLHWGVWTVLAAVCLSGSFVEKRLDKPAWLAAFRKISGLTICLLLTSFFAGAARYQLQRPVITDTDLAYYNDRQMELTGQVSDYPDERDNAVQLTLQVSEIQPEDTPASIPVEGKVLVRLNPGINWQYGDVIRLWGKLNTPAENEEFSYRDYLETRGIYSTMYYPYADRLENRADRPVLRAIYRLREYANQTIQSILPQPEAGLLSGILLGLEHDIPADLDEAFQKTGTTHIIAISGFNIAILSGLVFSGVSRLLPRFGALPVSILVITLYALMVGGQASVVRAAIMGSMALVGRQIGRQGAGVNSLTFTGAVMCLINPFLIRDAGFQLSFMATLGLVLYADPLHDGVQTWLEKHLPEEKARRFADPISEYFLFTLAAQMTTLPFIIYHFGRLSLSSILANVLILPVQPLVMELGGAALLAGMVWLPLGKVLGLLVWPLPAFTNRMVSLLAGIRGGSISLGAAQPWMLVIFYVLLLGLSLDTGLRKYFPGLKERIRRIKPSVVLAGMALFCVVLWRGTTALPDGGLHVYVMNVPDGPAVLVKTPQGENVLINSGSSSSRLSSELGQHLSLFDRRLDAVLVTAVKSKPLAGLPLSIERFPARMVLWNTEAAALRNGDMLKEVLKEQNVVPVWLETSQILDAGGSATLRVLQHDSSGTALLLAWDNFSMLIPGGIPTKSLTILDDPDVSAVDAILLSEEDLKHTSAGEWEQFQPILILWSGADNTDIPEDDSHWVHVDDLESVELSTDGKQIWVEVQK